MSSGYKVVAGIFYGLEWQGANLCAQKKPKEERVTDRSNDAKMQSLRKLNPGNQGPNPEQAAFCQFVELQ